MLAILALITKNIVSDNNLIDSLFLRLVKELQFQLSSPMPVASWQ